jgi:hypothetical protein
MLKALGLTMWGLIAFGLLIGDFVHLRDRLGDLRLANHRVAIWRSRSPPQSIGNVR